MADPADSDQVSKDDPRHRLAEDQRVIRVQLAAQEPAQPLRGVERVQRADAGVRERDRQQEDPSGLARGQVEKRGEEKGQREQQRHRHVAARDEAALLVREQSRADRPQPNSQRRNGEEEERGLDVVLQFRVALDGDQADGHRFGRRKPTEEQRDGEENAGGEGEGGDPEYRRGHTLVKPPHGGESTALRRPSS